MRNVAKLVLVGVLGLAACGCTSYEMASEESVLKGSRLLIETIPVSVYCSNCRSEQKLHSIQHFCCPACGTATPDVTRGKELEVVALEIAA